MLRGKGFLVLEAGWVAKEHECDTMEEATEEAARIYAATEGRMRVIIYAPVALVQPKLGPDTELKITDIGKSAGLEKPKQLPAAPDQSPAAVSPDA